MSCEAAWTRYIAADDQFYLAANQGRPCSELRALDAAVSEAHRQLSRLNCNWHPDVLESLYRQRVLFDHCNNYSGDDWDVW